MGQTAISVSGVTAGNLSVAITEAGGNLNTVTDLTVSGTIDSRDFLAMRNTMPVLAVVNLNATTVAAYNGNPANAIPSQAFYNANTDVAKTSLISIVFPSSITSIQLWAFTSCTGLTSLSIPNSVTFIGEQAFLACSGLMSLTLPASLTSIGPFAFRNCTGLTAVVIPEMVTSIAGYAFMSCSGLTSLNIPASVTSIGSSAFHHCSGLSSIYADSIIPIDLTSSSSVFSGVNVNTCILNVPSGSETAYATANQWQDFVNIGGVLGTNDFELDSKLVVYPNPSSGVFLIKSDTRSTMKVYDLTGKIIKTEKIDSGISKLDLSNNPSGIYSIKMTNEVNQTKTLKLIKQ